ncbi:MAG: hypothetical protein Fues2KO_22040 [Fuerstiella sp.]
MEAIMKKHALCLMVGVMAGCAETVPPEADIATPTDVSSAEQANAVQLVKFSCPGMH